jgi:hypothetical protein
MFAVVIIRCAFAFASHPLHTPAPGWRPSVNFRPGF